VADMSMTDIGVLLPRNTILPFEPVVSLEIHAVKWNSGRGR
jgi:hypothetical protein